jgi:hypothetical protein
VFGQNNGVGTFTLRDDSNTQHIALIEAGFAALRAVQNVSLKFGTNNTDRWEVNAAGDLIDLEGHFIEYIERSDPSAPAANKARLYAKDNGSGKTQLCARFNTGASQCFVTEP